MLCALSVQAPAYRRREPETSLLYRVVSGELDALRSALGEASPYGRSLPRHVDKELEAFLSCGILARGFARVVCRECRAEHLVGFSCKNRGLCPSCTTRRMHDTAAHLVDRVLPAVPMRQWVVTFPRRVRYHLGADPRLASEALQQVLRAIFAFQRRHARLLGQRPSRASSSGAVTFVPGARRFASARRGFNSALELSLHFHSLIPDGLFVRDGRDPDERPRFVELDPPTDAEVATLLDRIIARIGKLLSRRGYLDDDVINHEPEPLLLLASRPAKRHAEPFVQEPLPRRCARKDGFSLHAGITVHAHDRQGLERLARYGLRPALALDRLTEAPDGTLRYQMKRRFADGRHVLSFTPRELLLRLCALVPPPRVHTIRYAGIFAGHARGRYALTGRGLHDEHAEPASPTAETPTSASGTRVEPLPATGAEVAATLHATGDHSATPLRADHRGRDARLHVPMFAGPDDPGRDRRLEWATLMKRAYATDVLVCQRCAGRMRLVALILDERVATRILLHLGLPARAPPRGRPWRPPQRELDFDLEPRAADLD